MSTILSLSLKNEDTIVKRSSFWTRSQLIFPSKIVGEGQYICAKSQSSPPATLGRPNANSLVGGFSCFWTPAVDAWGKMEAGQRGSGENWGRERWKEEKEYCREEREEEKEKKKLSGWGTPTCQVPTGDFSTFYNFKFNHNFLKTPQWPISQFILHFHPF